MHMPGNLALQSPTFFFHSRIYNAGGSLSISNSKILDNSAVADGGGIYNDKGQITIDESIFKENGANGVGGGIFNGSGISTPMIWRRWSICGDSTIADRSALLCPDCMEWSDVNDTVVIEELRATLRSIVQDSAGSMAFLTPIHWSPANGIGGRKTVITITTASIYYVDTA
jgi:hypothetical protein